MPIDASLYGQFAPRVRSAEDVQNGLMQNAQAGMQMQNGLLDMQQKRDAIAQDNAMRQAVSESGGDPVRLRDALIARGLVKPLMEHDKTQALIGKDNAAAAKDNAKAGTEALTQARSMLPMVQTPEQFGQWVDGLYANPATAGVAQQFGTPEQVKSRIPADPAQFQKFLQMNAMGMDKFIQDQTSRANNKATNDTHITTTQMTNATSRANNAATQAGENARHGSTLANQRLIAGVDAQGNYTGASIGGGDAEKQLNYWAEVVRKGGTLPAGLARGKDGSAFVREVTKRAAMGDTAPADLMANQAEFVGAKAGQRTLGNKQANIEMAATEAYNMIPIALAASNKVDRTRFPSLNSILMAAEKGTGDENVVQLATATNSLVNVYARAISPTGNPTVSDKEHAREILDKAYAKGQFKAATDVMTQEIEAARKSPVQVREHMRPGATPTPAPTAAPAAGAYEDADKEKRYQEWKARQGK